MKKKCLSGLKKISVLSFFVCLGLSVFAQFDKLDVYVAPVAGGTASSGFGQLGTAITSGQNVTVNVDVHRSLDGSCASPNKIGVKLILRAMDTQTDPDWSSTGCHANRWLGNATAPNASVYNGYTGGDGHFYYDATTLTPQSLGTNQAATNPQGINMVQTNCSTIGGFTATYSYQLTLVNLPGGRYSIEVRADDYDATPAYQNSWTYSSCSGFGSGQLQYITVGKQGLFRQILVAETQTGGTSHDQYFYTNSFQPGNPSSTTYTITGSGLSPAGSLCKNDPFLIGYEIQTFKNTTQSGNVTGVKLQFSLTPTSGSGIGFGTKTAMIPFRTNCPSGNPNIMPGNGSCINTTLNAQTILDQMWQISPANIGATNYTTTIANGDATILVDATTGYIDIGSMIKALNGAAYPANTTYTLALTPIAVFGDGTTQTGSSLSKSFSTNDQVNSCTAIVLPITITNLKASNYSGNVLLQWQTATEVNSNYFDIEKSYDGSNFFALAQINAAGNSSFTKNYLYSDALNATDKIVYYRLKLVDRDGKFKYSNILAVAKQNSTTDITVLPNPTQNFIVLNGSKAGNVISITNAIGASVINQVLNTDNQVINTQKLSSGVYYIKILKANTVVTKQFVVAK